MERLTVLAAAEAKGKTLKLASRASRKKPADQPEMF